ncbi:MAG: abhydrolase domain-containing 18 [Acidobacteria bacterium]|nr:abhydrolase domain-containing 18 [Acidobacteriota bacterium]
MLGKLMHGLERRLAERGEERQVRPFEWGAEFVLEHADDDPPARAVGEYARRAVAGSDEFYALPAITDFRLASDLLTWTSAVETPSAENNTARAHFFREQTRAGRPRRARRAVVILPHWNAKEGAYFELARIFARLGIAALRLTLPYHEARRPPDLGRADHLVSPNVGRTLQSMRQAVVDTRAAVGWLAGAGYERVGVVGTSIGSCVAFLALAHEPLIRAGVFNHASGYVADVTWRGLSTAHVRAGIGDALTLETLRAAWLPVSPIAYIGKLASQSPRPIRFISARYDLTFPVDLSRDIIERVRASGHPLDVVWLPCGHYTLGETPFKYVDGWKIVSFIRKHL